MNIEMYRIFFEIQKKHWWFDTKRNIVLDTILRCTNLHNNDAILDIGCGSGLMLNTLEKVGNTYGMDISKEAIQFSSEIFSGPVKQGSLPNAIPYPKDYFSLITALDVIEHIDDDLGSLKTIRELLKNDGKAVITVPAYMCLWSHFDELNEHKRRYTHAELSLKLEQAGFEIEKISYYNTLLFPAIYVVRKLNNLLGRNGSSDINMPSSIVNRALKIIFGLEKFILRHSNMPFGVSLIAVVKNPEGS
ncbi:class I SAM-dependent methyltransferase [Polynucleobacter paneuropaeus]|nr:class I SAM-dependent methyltransferase [Polynucleobacter paneuropaeus]